MHSLGVILCMSLLFLEPAPFLYTYAFLHYAVGKERRAFLLLALEASWPIGEAPISEDARRLPGRESPHLRGR